ncbi:poly(3-hydroxybutyrate) depolymerase [Spirosoma sp. KCTC 42546]|uniref:alpha/beta hydrolase family esterase n=1 Tax=Spirosoma sp. KCTC 42546 TaxID=2520506 RepID=UPI00115A5496|nr:poly(3-hydroxybutyrate) depolymerase [Spirosoma sp. KCTC 42546]QDK83317.1 poly(3-hydroxybutyrate) depolymerase [Spirosoma sp. KCTC 42546]
MVRFLLLICVLGLSIASAQKPLLTDSILVEGHYRTFHFIKPAKANSSLIFILHGSGGNGEGARKGAEKLEEKSDSENLLLVYPDGYKRYWNECRKTANSVANKEDINENAFFGEMINYFTKKYQINTKQVFAVGTSGGGHMAYKLALTMPEKFRAITALIANLPDTNNLDCPEKRIAVPVMIVNGTADQTNPYEGGEVITGTISMGLVRSTERTFHYWADLAGYKKQPLKELLPDTDPNDHKTIERYTYKEKGKPEVTLLKVIGGKHDYPNDINVYLEAWDFFKRQLTQP